MKVQNNTIKLTQLLFVLLAIVGLQACDNSSTNDEPQAVTAQIVTDLAADTVSRGRGEPHSYDYYRIGVDGFTAIADSNSTDWDIALGKTDVMLNSGVSGPGNVEAQVLNTLFEDVYEAPETGYGVDSEEAKIVSDWYNYTGMTEPMHAIFPKPGFIVVFKTNDGLYGKLEIISYYKGNPDTSTESFINLATRPASGYYTIRYAVQEDGSRFFSEAAQ